MDGITVTPKATPNEPAKVEPGGDTHGIQAGPGPDLDAMHIGNFLGVNPFDSQNGDKLYFVIEELRGWGNKSRGDIMKAISKIEHKIGSPNLATGENRIGKLYNFVKANKIAAEAIKERDSYL